MLHPLSASDKTGRAPHFAPPCRPGSFTRFRPCLPLSSPFLHTEAGRPAGERVSARVRFGSCSQTAPRFLGEGRKRGWRP